MIVSYFDYHINFIITCNRNDIMMAEDLKWILSDKINIGAMCKSWAIGAQRAELTVIPDKRKLLSLGNKLIPTYCFKTFPGNLD